MLVTRIWDTVSDLTGSVASRRTHTVGSGIVPICFFLRLRFISGVLLFTTPDLGETGKLVWAYVTYILMMTANLYRYQCAADSMLGVMGQ